MLTMEQLYIFQYPLVLVSDLHSVSVDARTKQNNVNHIFSSIILYQKPADKKEVISQRF